jgi:phosphatidylserine decarboxylase
MSDALFVALQRILPKLYLTRTMGLLAKSQGGIATTAAIKWFIQRYKVDMSEAADPDPAAYASFNAFFTRALRADARPQAQAPYLCPVDGAISQFGAIARDQIFQAKGHHYSTTALLGGDETLARNFEDGAFATIYLSPRDYHRIHMPMAGRLYTMIHVPGALYSVNPATARGIPGLFAINERVVCMFDTEHGPFALVLVGATIVGSMATVWHGIVNPPRPGTIRRWDYANASVELAKGAEMGRFLLGSTVVLLWPRNVIRFNPAWAPGGAVRMGEAMGSNA